MTRALYYEDFEVGQQLVGKTTYTISKESSIAFCKEYDPQPQHIDEHGAKDTLFGELIVSGWQTAAISMRLKTETELVYMANGLVGIGLENLRWPRPTRPGDTLRVVITIADKRLSKSLPDKGIIKYKVETLNQRNEIAMDMLISVIAPLKKAK